MSNRYWRKLALLAKVEATYGTDSTPTGSENAILASDVTFTPLEGGEENRDLLLPYLGNQGVILTGLHARLEFSVELAGAGTAGTAPEWGSLLRACGMAQTITEDTSAAYTPVSDAFESATLWYNRDGVKHAIVGWRGNVSLALNPSRIPKLRFTGLGLHGTAATDTALPTMDVTKWKTPVVVSKANTTFALHGFSGPTESISIDLGNQVEARMLIGEEAVIIGDRRASGSAVLAARSLATKNWDAIARAHTRGTMAIQHGTTAGNIVEITAPAVQIGRWSEGQTQGIVNNTLPLMICPSAGNDDLVITVK